MVGCVYGMSTLVDYLLPNPVYTHTHTHTYIYIYIYIYIISKEDEMGMILFENM